MRAIRVERTFAGSVAEAERCWYDPTRWPRWVDGLDEVLEVSPDWPAAGGSLRWVSGPAGRGEVTEQVLSREPLRGQTVRVIDGRTEGEQSVSFTPADQGVEVAVALQYRFRHNSLTMRVIDPLFIRRAMIASLRATVERFGAELEVSRTRPPA